MADKPAANPPARRATSAFKGKYEEAKAALSKTRSALAAARGNVYKSAAIDTVEAGVGGAIAGAIDGYGYGWDLGEEKDMHVPYAILGGPAVVALGVSMKQRDAVEVGKGAFAYACGSMAATAAKNVKALMDEE